ncbi:MAG: hypothetical protein NC428_11985 [Clostridium sp.]|nr:hypothetical protein [Clostridium sp.]
MENFGSMLEEVKTLVQDEINNPSKRPDYISETQLYAILDELNKMGRIRNSRLFYPYYPRGLADSWSFSNQLGDKLLNLLELYKKL